MNDDTISRKATIDAMEGVDWYHIDKDGKLVHGANSKEDEPLYKAKDVYVVLNKMPSAETHEKRTETHACDCISRQAAVEAIENTDWYHLMDGVMVRGANSKEHQAWYKEQDIYKALEQLPSAQPEITICIECVHYEPLGKEKAWGRCSVHSSPTENQRFVQSCDFCAWAERKTDG